LRRERLKFDGLRPRGLRRRGDPSGGLGHVQAAGNRSRSLLVSASNGRALRVGRDDDGQRGFPTSGLAARSFHVNKSARIGKEAQPFLTFLRPLFEENLAFEQYLCSK